MIWGDNNFFLQIQSFSQKKSPREKRTTTENKLSNFRAVCKCASWIKSIVPYSHQAIHHDTNICKYRWFRLSWNESNFSQIISRSNFQITSTNKLFIETWTLSIIVVLCSRDGNAVTNPPTHWQNVCWKIAGVSSKDSFTQKLIGNLSKTT